MLESRGISVFYGRHRALENVSLTVSKGEIVVMLGANGAGKSTFLRAVAGQVRKRDGGSVLMDGRDISRQPPHDIVEAGIALVPEDRGIFADLTVQENLILGAYPRRARPSETANMERVLSLFPKLGERRKQLVRTMSGGERQMVAISCSMNPRSAWRRSCAPSSSAPSRASRRPASAFSWLSRTRGKASPSPIAAIS